VHHRIAATEGAGRSAPPTDDALALPLDAESATLEQLLSQMPVVAWATDRDLRYTSLVGAPLTPPGINAADLVGESVEAVLRGDASREIALEAHRRALAGETVTYERVTDAGVTINARVGPLFDDAGAIVGAVGVRFDVTEARRARTEFADRIRQQALVAELGHRAIATGDVAALIHEAMRLVGEQLDVVCSLMELTADTGELVLRAGYGTEQWRVGLPITQLGPAAAAIRTGAPIVALDVYADDRFEAPAVFAELGLSSVVALPIFAPGPEVVGAVNAMSREPRSFTDEDIHFLDSVGYVLGAAIARDRLEAALKVAQGHALAAHRLDVVGALAGGVAHDFNNMLTAISGYTELLTARLADAGEDVLHDLGEVKRAAEQASGLTRRLLAFSRQQLRRPRAIDLDSELRALRMALAYVAGDGVTLDLKLAAPHHVEADVDQLEQVLFALVSNAREAMQDSGRIAIETAGARLGNDATTRWGFAITPGDYVRLAVEDDGPGINPTVRQRLFEPFATTKPSGQGGGLGLASVFGIVKQSGGYIVVGAGAAGGARFEIYLPALAD